jgi:hypothetical protein
MDAALGMDGMKMGLRSVSGSALVVVAAAIVSPSPSAGQSTKIEMIETKSFADEEKKMVHFAFRMPDVSADKLEDDQRNQLEASLKPGIHAKNCLVLNSKGSTFAFAKRKGGYIESEMLDESYRHIFTVTTKWENCQG